MWRTHEMRKGQVLERRLSWLSALASFKVHPPVQLCAAMILQRALGAKWTMQTFLRFDLSNDQNLSVSSTMGRPLRASVVDKPAWKCGKRLRHTRFMHNKFTIGFPSGFICNFCSFHTFSPTWRLSWQAIPDLATEMLCCSIASRVRNDSATIVQQECIR